MNSCGVCYDSLLGNDEPLSKVTLCGHLLHTQCFNQWFSDVNRAGQCPSCGTRQLGDSIAPKGIAPEEITPYTHGENEDCVVCGTILDEDYVKTVPCGHIYHLHCIENWREIRNICPLCRRSITNMSPVTKYDHKEVKHETNRGRTEIVVPRQLSTIEQIATPKQAALPLLDSGVPKQVLRKSSSRNTLVRRPRHEQPKRAVPDDVSPAHRLASEIARLVRERDAMNTRIETLNNQLTNLNRSVNVSDEPLTSPSSSLIGSQGKIVTLRNTSAD